MLLLLLLFSLELNLLFGYTVDDFVVFVGSNVRVDKCLADGVVQEETAEGKREKKRRGEKKKNRS